MQTQWLLYTFAEHVTPPHAMDSKTLRRALLFSVERKACRALCGPGLDGNALPVMCIFGFNLLLSHLDKEAGELVSVLRKS